MRRSLVVRLATSVIAALVAILGGAAADPGRVPSQYEAVAVVPAIAAPDLVDAGGHDTLDSVALARAAELSTQASEIEQAAAAANAAKTAAEAAAKAAAEAAAKQKALGYDPSLTDPRQIARQMMLNRYAWDDTQFACFDKIITQESRWKVSATNPSSGAYGIPQALPGSKMASAGADWKTNPATQIAWALGYVKQRYGTPCQAWSFKQRTGWY